MKKLLTLAGLAALCAVLAGCAQTMPSPQTGRSVTINQTFNHSPITANALPTAAVGEEQSLADTQGASGSVLSPSGTIWTVAESEGGQISTPTAATDVSPTTSMNYGTGGDGLVSLTKMLTGSFTGSDGKVDWDGLKKQLTDAGYDKKAVDDCVAGICNEAQQ